MDAKGFSPHPKKGLRTGALLGFLDETGFSDRPTVRRTWSKKEKTPVIPTAGGWKNRTVIGTIIASPLGNRPRFFCTIIPSAMRSPDIITYLKNLKRHIKGRRLILFWDGLCAHRSKSTSEYVKSRKSRLTTERTPAYAPEVNPAGRI